MLPQMTHHLKKLDLFHCAGALFSVWALTNTYIDISRYGWEQGFYWWFCNLALIGTAFGLLFKHRGWLTGFLSIACFTQIFWVIDNQYRVFTGHNLFGLVEFMYQPGLPLDEFLLSHYHYFTIPVALTALVFLPPQKSNALLLISIFNPLIFAVSYFAFPPTQNVNCIHAPCFPNLAQWAGPAYSLGFWAAIFLAHLLIGYSLEKYLSEASFSEPFKRKVSLGFVFFMAVACASACWDTRYRLSLPSFKCRSLSSNDMEVQCRFTLDYTPQNMLFVYRLKSLKPTPQRCSSFFDFEGQTIPLQKQFVVQGFENKQLDVVVPYPPKNVEILLHAKCEESSKSQP
jgi:hypothetical protein